MNKQKLNSVVDGNRSEEKPRATPIWDVNRANDKKQGSWSFHMNTSKLFLATFDFGAELRPMHLLVQGRYPHNARWRTVVEAYCNVDGHVLRKIVKKFAPSPYEDEFIAWLEYREHANDIWRETSSLGWDTKDWHQIWFDFGFGGSSNPQLRIDWTPNREESV